MFERMIRCLVIFNHNDGPQASASTTEITNAVPRPARIAFYTVLAGKQCGIAGHRVMKSRLRPATISPPRAGPRPLAETVQPLPKKQESHRDSAPIRGWQTRGKAGAETSARQPKTPIPAPYSPTVETRSIQRGKCHYAPSRAQPSVLSPHD